jgi:hypothetical protein
VPQGTDQVFCAQCEHMADKVFLKAPAGFVQRDICYDSPVDGTPITNRQARLNDLARHECIPYEPGMRQDAERNRLDAEARLDRAMDETVDAALEVMSARKKEQLVTEISSGADVAVERGTPTLH